MEIVLFGPQEREETVELTTPAGDLDIQGDYALEDGVLVVCRIVRNDDIVRVDGEVSARLTVQCARCLEDFSRDVSGVFSFLVKRMPAGIPVPDEAGEQSDDERELIHVGHDTVEFDIFDAVREALILALPMRMLCRENCRGLCVVCGNNLNEHDCGCRPEREDPRWKNLGGLFDEK